MTNRLLLSYVALWAFEGAGRKWVPGADLILYFGRDVLLLMWFGWAVLSSRHRQWHHRGYVSFLIGVLCALVILSLLQAVAFSGIPLAVTVVGLRSYAVPLLFASVLLMSYPHAKTIIVALAPLLGFIMLGQLIIVVLQVLSPPDAAVNLLIGEGETLFVNSGIVRPSGTFSAPSGLTCFAVLSAALGGYVLALRDDVRASLSRSVLLSAAGLFAGSAILALLGGSRALVLQVGLILLVASIMILRRTSRRNVVPVMAGGLFLTVFVAAMASGFEQVIQAFIVRVDQASRVESFWERVGGQLLGFLSTDGGVLGSGMGTNSQAGIALGATGPWLEIESAKWASELGMLGLLLIALSWLFLASAVRVGTHPDAGAAVLVAATVPQFAVGQVTQTPTLQAFSGLLLGLLLICVDQKARRLNRRHPSPPLDLPRRRALVE